MVTKNEVIIGGHVVSCVSTGTLVASPDHAAGLRAGIEVGDISRGLHNAHGPCEAGLTPYADFSIFHCNIKGFLYHRAELEGQLYLMPALPNIVCLNETFLDESVDHIELGCYTLVSRRDLDDGRSGGGIAVFVRHNFAGQVILREHSQTHERSWHTIHSEMGPLFLCVWYRKPNPCEI